MKKFTKSMIAKIIEVVSEILSADSKDDLWVLQTTQKIATATSDVIVGKYIIEPIQEFYDVYKQIYDQVRETSPGAYDTMRESGFPGSRMLTMVVKLGKKTQYHVLEIGASATFERGEFYGSLLTYARELALKRSAEENVKEVAKIKQELLNLCIDEEDPEGY